MKKKIKVPNINAFFLDDVLKKIKKEYKSNKKKQKEKNNNG